MKLSVAVVILTYNEEVNLGRCLQSVLDWTQEVFIIDSYSTDKTFEIAKKYRAEIIQHKFINQANQFNWALDHLDIKSDWILKLDADEYILPELAEEIKNTLSHAPQETAGFYIKRRFYFMEQWIKHGGYYPAWFLRLWRKGMGRSEERKMDEHIVLSEGKVEWLKNDFVDDNKKDLKAWILKHKDYASREAEEVKRGQFGTGKKRNFYYRLPPFLRVLLYFVYRYFLRLGFLDGVAGLRYHLLQGFWYRILIDAKICGLSKI